MDEATLELLRESSGLRLDAEGQLWHEGTRLEHGRTVAALHRGLHRAPDGRWATRLGTEWAYVAVEDTAFFVRAVELDEARGTLVCTLWGEERAQVDPATLAAGAGDALYVRLASGERARLTRTAQLSLAARLRASGPGFALEAFGRLFAIGVDAGPEPRWPGRQV